MIYIENLVLPTEDDEWNFFIAIKRTCYNNFYPFQIFHPREIGQFSFKDITVFCGGNGSGKSTVLNVIAEKYGISRYSNYNKSVFFKDFVNLCRGDKSEEFTFMVKNRSRIITSDDIFNFLQLSRDYEDDIDERRVELTKEYFKYKNMDIEFKSMDDSERISKILEARRLTSSKYVKKYLQENIKGRSNGQEALDFFKHEISENALYLLDEPENSLSPKAQMELVEYIEKAVRYFKCQFIISTHSPIISSLAGSRNYDFDKKPFGETRWEKLENVQVYRELIEKKFK